MKRGFRTFIWLVFVVAATLLLFPSQGAAQHVDLVDHDGFHLDHFKCYATHSWPPKHVGVGLQDQFDILDWTFDDHPDPNGHEWHQVEFPVRFCNPVQKTTEDGTITYIQDKDAHLVMYDTAPFDLPAKPRLVFWSNQFGDGLAFTADAHVLAVPTQKEGHDAPYGLDHYKCYPADPIDSVLDPALLEDQFHIEETSVLFPVLFCNPTRKFHGSVVTEIKNKDDHLVCYKILSHGEDHPAPPHVVYTNQFEHRQVPVGKADMLCVPSEKEFFLDWTLFTTGGIDAAALPAEVQSLLGTLGQ